MRRERATDVRLSVAICVVACASAAVLAGCMMGPDYTRPKVDAPAAFRVEPKAAADTANTEWWKQFNDPVLDALIAEALANNLNVKIAAANILQASGLLVQTRSDLFPQVGYSGTGERLKVPNTGLVAVIPNYPNPQSTYQALLNVSWEIDLWGRMRRLDAQLAVAQSTLGTYAESVKLFELQFKYGQVSQMNVAQAQSQYQNAAAQIPQIESQIAQTENALSV